MAVLVELEPSQLTSQATAEAETESCGKSGCYTYSSYSATYTNATYSSYSATYTNATYASPSIQYIPVYEYVPVPTTSSSSNNNNLWLILLIIIALIIISLLVVVVAK